MRFTHFHNVNEPRSLNVRHRIYILLHSRISSDQLNHRIQLQINESGGILVKGTDREIDLRQTNLELTDMCSQQDTRELMISVQSIILYARIND